MATLAIGVTSTSLGRSGMPVNSAMMSSPRRSMKSRPFRPTVISLTDNPLALFASIKSTAFRMIL